MEGAASPLPLGVVPLVSRKKPPRVFSEDYAPCSGRIAGH